MEEYLGSEHEMQKRRESQLPLCWREERALNWHELIDAGAGKGKLIESEGVRQMLKAKASCLAVQCSTSF